MYIQKCEVLSSFLLFIILTDIEIKNHDNPFQPTGLFLYPPPPPQKKKKKIFCAGPPTYFGLKFLGPPKIRAGVDLP